jgi:hypothetical protein
MPKTRYRNFHFIYTLIFSAFSHEKTGTRWFEGGAEEGRKRKNRSPTVADFPIRVDCERSLLSAGLDFRACERKGGTADDTSTALPTQRKIPIGRNRYACQSNLICSNYAINNFQSECWFYTGCVRAYSKEISILHTSEQVSSMMSSCDVIQGRS